MEMQTELPKKKSRLFVDPMSCLGTSVLAIEKQIVTMGCLQENMGDGSEDGKIGDFCFGAGSNEYDEKSVVGGFR